MTVSLTTLSDARQAAASSATRLVASSQRLDETIGGQINVVIDDTEASATLLIQQVRALNDSATALLGILGATGTSASAIELTIDRSATSIDEISSFVKNLPAMIRTDVEGVHQAAMTEINGLAGFVQVISDISKKTNILAINAAIVAATSGEAGRGFSVVASEVRALSQHSAAAAEMIQGGLETAQRTLQDGMKTSAIDRHVADAEAIIGSIHALKANYDRMREHYRSQFDAVTEVNQSMSRELADMLGQIQFQDVVRQRLERVLDAVDQRNVILAEFATGLGDPSFELSVLPDELDQIHAGYVEMEEQHSSVSRNLDGQARIELF